MENTINGALGVIGYDARGERYRLLPAKDRSLAVMSWPGNSGTPQMRIQIGVLNLLALKDAQNNNGDLFVGPAVDYSNPKEVRVDEKGAALWTKVG